MVLNCFSMKPVIEKFEEELIEDWVKNMETQEWQYKEPIINSETVSVLKNVCKHLHQDIHVFVTAVELLENYIRVKFNDVQKIKDPFLSIAAAITISSKQVGDKEIKVKYVQDWLVESKGTLYNQQDILSAEMEMLNSIESLPHETVVDDLTTLATKFEHNYKIKASILPLCLNVLEMLYLTRNEWFVEFKTLYALTKETSFIFTKLMRSRMYIPSAVIIYALKLTAYKDSFDIKLVTEDLAARCEIHVDHLCGFVRQLKKVFQRY